MRAVTRVNHRIVCGLILLSIASCRDTPTTPVAAEELAPVISFEELARRVLADPLLRRIAEQVNRPDVAAHVDAILTGLRDRNGLAANGTALGLASVTLARSLADPAATGDSTAAPTEEQILEAVLDLAVQTVGLLRQASVTPGQTTFQGVR